MDGVTGAGAPGVAGAEAADPGAADPCGAPEGGSNGSSVAESAADSVAGSAAGSVALAAGAEAAFMELRNFCLGGGTALGVGIPCAGSVAGATGERKPGPAPHS